MICNSCGKEIPTEPCSYCGSSPKSGASNLGATIVGVTVKGSSEVAVQKGDEVKVIQFHPDVTSKYIVEESIQRLGLSGVTPQYVQNQMVNNIDTVEQYIQEHSGQKTTDEYSATLNLGIIKLSWKRRIER
jgi:hypothetical protein